MNFSYSDICAHLCTNNSRLKGIQLQHLNHTIFCSLILQIHLELGIWIWSCPTRALSYHLNQHLFTPQFPFPSPSIPLSCPPVGSPVSCVCFCLCWARLATTWLSVAALGQSCAMALTRTSQKRVAEISIQRQTVSVNLTHTYIWLFFFVAFPSSFFLHLLVCLSFCHSFLF